MNRRDQIKNANQIVCARNSAVIVAIKVRWSDDRLSH